MKKTLMVLAAGVQFAALSIDAQSFQNLDFEQANPVSVGGPPFYQNQITASSALPDWTVTIGGVQQAVVTLNNPTTGAPWVSIASQPILFAPSSPIDGNYSVFLQGTIYNAAISQTGLIPAGKQSLLFDVGLDYFGTLNVLVANQNVPLSVVGPGPNNSTVFGGDISAWAGQTDQLTISAALGFWEIDDIAFSQNAVVPEPSPLVLTGIGGLLFALHRRLRHR